MSTQQEWQFFVIGKDTPIDLKKIQIGKKYKVTLGRMTLEMTGFEIQQYAQELDRMRDTLLFLYTPLRTLEHE